MITEALTMVYASNVPMDMNSTSFSKSKNSAISAHMNADIAKLIIGTCGRSFRLAGAERFAYFLYDLLVGGKGRERERERGGKSFDRYERGTAGKKGTVNTPTPFT